MTTSEYIVSKLSGFNYTPLREEVDTLVTLAGLPPTSEYGAATHGTCRTVLLTMIPDMLAQPVSVSEGDMSIQRDREGLEKFYALLSKETNSDNLLRPAVRDRSNRW